MRNPKDKSEPLGVRNPMSESGGEGLRPLSFLLKTTAGADAIDTVVDKRQTTLLYM